MRPSQVKQTFFSPPFLLEKEVFSQEVLTTLLRAAPGKRAFYIHPAQLRGIDGGGRFAAQDTIAKIYGI